MAEPNQSGHKLPSSNDKVFTFFKRYAKTGGASFFAEDFAEQGREEAIGIPENREHQLGMNKDDALALYDVSNNPVFLWLCVYLSNCKEGLPDEVYEYLHDASVAIAVRFKHEVRFQERVRFDPKEDFPKSIKRIKRPSMKLFKNFDPLGINHPGKDMFLQASVDYRNYVVSCMVHQRAKIEKIMPISDLYKVIAVMFGRISSKTGVSGEAIKAMDARGRKVIRALTKRQARE